MSLKKYLEQPNFLATYHIQWLCIYTGLRDIDDRFEGEMMEALYSGRIDSWSPEPTAIYSRLTHPELFNEDIDEGLDTVLTYAETTLNKTD